MAYSIRIAGSSDKYYIYVGHVSKELDDAVIIGVVCLQGRS